MAEEKNSNLTFGGIFTGLAVLLFLLSIFSYQASDLAVLDGGINGPVSNWIGPLGAHISRAFFYLFGVASYPIVILLALMAIRPLIAVPMSRKWKQYLPALLLASLGCIILFGLFPQEFVNMTDKLGIGHVRQPSMALSGGTIGMLLAAPETEVFPAGLIRRCIGIIGTGICAVVFLLSGLILIFWADWKAFLLIPKTGKKSLPEEKPEPAPVKEEAKPQPPAPLRMEPEEEASPAPAQENSLKQSLMNIFGSKEKKPEVAQPDNEDDGENEELVNLKRRLRTLPEEDLLSLPKTPETAVSESAVPAEEPAIAEKIPASAAAAEPQPVKNAVEKIVDDPFAAPSKPAPPPVSHRTQPVIPELNRPYELPPISLLDRPKEVRSEDSDHLDMAKATLQATLDSFDINGTVTETIVGPRITRFEISLQPGVRVEKVSNIQNNIAKDMRAESIRILAPVPGRDTVGIELPNKVSNMVFLRELMESDAWRNTKANIPIILGKDVAGKVMITDLAKAPHLLIAGTTGSGKSVCMNTLIMSLLYKFSPFDLKLIMVDPKYVELAIYTPLPHLITPVVNDPTKVPYALRWGVNEMEHRYQVMAKVKAKNLEAFNGRPPDPEPVFDENDDPVPAKLPLLIIIVDELADIMMTEARKDVETSICRIAQKGRAAGIHLVIATQTPRKDIITGTIKANLPSKIAFKVSTGMDSRVILDAQGAEKLLGKGDMLFKGPAGETERIQGSMVSDPEIQKIADFVSSQVPQHFDTTVILENPDEGEEKDDGVNSFADESYDDEADDFIHQTIAKYIQPGDDENVRKALEIILRENKASTSYLQRRMGIGYNKSAEIIDKLEQRGIVSPPLAGGQKRTILIFDELNRPNEN